MGGISKRSKHIRNLNRFKKKKTDGDGDTGSDEDDTEENDRQAESPEERSTPVNEIGAAPFSTNM